MKKILMMNIKDNVAICLNDLTADTLVNVSNKDGNISDEFAVLNDIPFAHKVALADIKSGDLVIKYGEIIGRVTQDITKGEWVHVHNVESTRARGDKNDN